MYISPFPSTEYDHREVPFRNNDLHVNAARWRQTGEDGVTLKYSTHSTPTGIEPIDYEDGDFHMNYKPHK